MNDNTNGQNETFESALARLEQIVRTLESGTAPLDETMTLFEEGVRLVKVCTEKIENAEQRVKLASMTQSGEIKTEEFQT